MWERGEAAERGQGMLGRTQTQGSLPDLSLIGKEKKQCIDRSWSMWIFAKTVSAGKQIISTDIRCCKRINSTEKK